MKESEKAILALCATLAMTCDFAVAGDEKAAAMLRVAGNAGCLVCHAVEAGAKGPEGLKPVGPAWTDVAERYRNDSGAQARLVSEVMKGTSLYDRHWKDKASGIAMPPNAVAISETDAQRLVAWILELKK
ncbi:MAG: c-type cytochrome [Rhodocyclales bacterium]|nr:c-type cytochrome [Rhodocyclales bacterium]